MHSYSIDSHVRRTVYYGLAALALAIPGTVAALSERAHTLVASAPVLAWPLSMGTTFGVLFLVFDRFLWRVGFVVRLHGVPNLNGRWKIQGLSSFDPNDDGTLRTRYEMQATIRQTFTRIEVFTETEYSCSRSTMASICSDSAMPTFRYAYDNVPKSKSIAELQRHPGLIELRMSDSKTMSGDYFSGKHRLRYGELTFKRMTP